MRHLPLIAALILAFAASASAADLDAKGTTPAIGSDGNLAAVVFADDVALSCSVSHDGGVTFDRPVSVGNVSPSQMLGMRRGPQIAVRGSTILIVSNAGKGRTIPAFRSTDAGKTWQGPVNIDDPSGRSAEGLMALTATRDGFAVVYLELLESKKGQRIALTRSTDDGKTFLKSQLVYASPDGSVCECCQPTITSDRAGNVEVMFRNNIDGNRDMFLASSKDDGKTFSAPAKLGNGSWKLIGCPMDGGNLTFVKNSVTTVFRRQNTLFLARPGEAETEFATGKSPVIAATPSGPVIAWEARNGVAVHVPGAEELKIADAVAPVLTTTSRGVLLAYSVPGAQVHTRLVWLAKP